MTSLEKLKKCFTEIEVSFLERVGKEYTLIYLCLQHEEKNGRLDADKLEDRNYFEFLNSGELVSCP